MANGTSLLDELRTQYEAARTSPHQHSDVEGFEAINARMRKVFAYLEKAVNYLDGLKPPIEHRFDLGHGMVFEAPKFRGTTLVAPAYITVFWNGVLVQHRRAVMGSTSATTTAHDYAVHDPELPIMLQDHAHPVRYRNIWVRRLAGYDQPEMK